MLLLLHIITASASLNAAATVHLSAFYNYLEVAAIDLTLR